MSVHGEYRPLFVGLADDQDAHALCPIAFKAWTMMLLSLPPTGIGTVYLHVLAEQVGCELEDLTAALLELESPTTARPSGWLRREGKVVWLYDVLAAQPNLKPTNTMHVTSVRKRLANLQANLPIVRDFKAAHPQWFDSLSDSPSHSLSDSPSSSSSSSLSPSSKQQPTSTELPVAALQLLDCVGAGERQQVEREMRAVLNSGHPFCGQRVQASVDRLARKCRETLDARAKGTVFKPWSYCLVKLADSSDGSSPGAQEARKLAAPDPAEAELDQWMADHPDVVADLKSEIAPKYGEGLVKAAVIDAEVRTRSRELAGIS